ncbi:MFS transporter [Pseudonocardia sp. MH-G8]|uniref:MFS transporter n=1 Tax=Pseudonocardia sp. MH-G8 TaxID=1854588 RepID=UPI000BA09C46|nr:MFS transporter [Pseudonocardia sp. MH-G8]OZM79284.1 MFS transporter [Pseudonocardia sp. MH-G8]
MERTQDVGRRQVVSAGIASVMGWGMDLYDLMIILYVASTIGPLLVPAGSTTLQLAFVYASFAVTLIMRPAGSAVFGSFADRNGRKKAMLVAITGVGVSTALMGLVPTYAVAGVAAPLLFVLLRLVQGVFVGGVVASTHTLGTETVGPRHRGLMSGLVSGGGAGVGAVLASTVFFVVSSLFPGEAFTTVGWRVMFLSGLLAAALSFFVYRRTEESPLWAGKDEQAGPRASRSPLRTLFSPSYRPIFLVNLVLVTGGASLYYLTVGFFPTFFDTTIGLPKTTAAAVLIVINLAVVLGGVLGGMLSDRIGRRRTFLALGIPTLLIVCPLYLLTSTLTGDDVALVLLLCAIMGLLMMTATAPIMIFLNERFPTAIRATGTGMSWNAGYALGGMTPTVVTLLSPEVADIPSRVTAVFAVMAVLFLLGAAIAPETAGRDLRAVDAPGEQPVGPSAEHQPS